MIFIQPISEISKFSPYYLNMIKSEEPKWGITERLYPTFKKISKNDIILNYYKKSIVSIGIVDYTLTSKKIAKKFFSDAIHPSGELISYPHIIIFKKIVKCDIDFEKIKDKLGYSSNYYVRRLIPLNQIGLDYFGVERNNTKEVVKYILDIK